MEMTKITEQGVEIALVNSQEALITDVQSALDLIATVNYETGCYRIILNQSSVPEAFFDLKTGLAGEVIQKFINYRVKVAIVGDFSSYTSKSLKDFIYECNQGRDLFFVSTKEEALTRLARV